MFASDLKNTLRDITVLFAHVIRHFALSHLNRKFFFVLSTAVFSISGCVRAVPVLTG